MKELATEIIASIVSKPEEVDVTEKAENDYTVLEIKVATDDMSRVIGKEGKVIRSLRNVLRVAALKNKDKVFVRLIEPLASSDKT